MPEAADLVLVTGASGFVGSAVARALKARGARLRLLARATSPRTNLEGLDAEIVVGVEPAILDRLLVQEGAGIGRGERDLDGVRIDLVGEADGLLDRLLGLAGKPEDEGAVDGDAELVAILGEATGDVDQHALLDVVQDLLIAGLIADEQQPEPVVAQHLERVPRHIGLGVARPGDAELAEPAGDGLGARQV
ncbi:MAG TPA: NAD-dependent epimerase/dehydratase family protein, partial [Caulobacteraceae bacterium]|nr:NAD-dependent epimerase/dehydratase family protein [Caulobacteraceae bacterium]